MNISIRSGIAGITFLLLSVILLTSGCDTPDDVSPASLYAFGFLNDGSRDVAGYWKDGAWNPVAPSGDDTYAVGGLVSGGSVYLVGSRIDASLDVWPCYWKDGVLIDLSSGESVEGVATSIAVNGSDVFIAGYYVNGSSNQQACYWINTTRTDIPYSGPMTESAALGILYFGGSVHVCGVADETDLLGNSTIAFYSIDGNAWTQLTNPDSSNEGIASDITIHSGSITIAGSRWVSGEKQAGYWDLAWTEVDSAVGTAITDILSFGGSLYMAGFKNSADSGIDAGYWQDTGSFVQLDSWSGTSRPQAIALDGNGQVLVAGFFGEGGILETLVHPLARTWQAGRSVDYSDGRNSAIFGLQSEG